MTQTAKLSASDGTPNDYFGSSVFTNGNLALVGAMFATVGNRYQKGAAYIFVKPAKGWKTTSKFNQRVIAKDKAVSLFGASVSMSGKTAVIGVPYSSLGTNPNQGAAYVFGQRWAAGRCHGLDRLAVLLHRFTPLAQKCGYVEIGLLEIRDHGVSHAID